MKKIFQYFLIVVLFSAWGVILTNQDQAREIIFETRNFFQKPCSKPIKYSLGEVDPRFGLSRQEVLDILSEAESIWEKEAGLDLFSFDPNGNLRINLIYDERQERAIEIGRLESELEGLQKTEEQLGNQYQSLLTLYEKKNRDYESLLSSYQKKLEKHQVEVKKWNSRGGAPQEEYDLLNNERKELENIRKELKERGEDVNLLIAKINQLAGKNNQLVRKYNENLDTYKSRYGQGREFEKGMYDFREINVYQFKERSDLILTLVHEMGHALGIDHLENPRSAMHYLIGEQNLENPKLTEDDVFALKSVCRIRE